MQEPDELYARYYLRFDKSWNARRSGKLPGPAGRYGRGGWGGRTSDGTNGWSARMRSGKSFFGPDYIDNLALSTRRIGTATGLNK